MRTRLTSLETGLVALLAVSALINYVDRQTLSVLKRSATPEIFSKITWDNAHTLLKIERSAFK